MGDARELLELAGAEQSEEAKSASGTATAPMPAGYVRVWVSMEEAVDHVTRVTKCGRQEARDAVVRALLDAELRSRFGDNGLQEIKAPLWQNARQWALYSGLGARIPNKVQISGKSAYLRPFFDPQPDPALLPERMRPVEVRRKDVERLWSMPPGSEDAPGYPEPSSPAAPAVGSGGAMAIRSRRPDWDWWRHVPTVSLHEAVALSLNIDPQKLRRAHDLIRRQFDEGPEFERRLALATRCLGDILSGPVNYPAVCYFDEAPAIRLRDFAAWAQSVDWQLPPELARLPARERQSANALDPDPDERLSLPEQVRLLARIMPEERARARIDKAFRFREINYQPQYAVRYDDAKIDWVSGRVTLPRLSRQPFTPTLTAAEFSRHFARAFAEGPQSAMSRQEPEEHLDTLENTPGAEPTLSPGFRTNRAEDAERACEGFISELTERPRTRTRHSKLHAATVAKRSVERPLSALGRSRRQPSGNIRVGRRAQIDAPENQIPFAIYGILGPYFRTLLSISAEPGPGISVLLGPTLAVEERSSTASTEGTRARRAVPSRATKRRAWGGAVGPRGRSAGLGPEVRCGF